MLAPSLFEKTWNRSGTAGPSYERKETNVNTDETLAAGGRKRNNTKPRSPPRLRFGDQGMDVMPLLTPRQADIIALARGTGRLDRVSMEFTVDDEVPSERGTP
jgi:hypothetical protein